MNLRSCSVDLVEEKDSEVVSLGQHGARFDTRTSVLVDMGLVKQVARQQVDSALDTREGPADDARDGAQERGLARADVSGEQHMPPAQHRQQNEMHRLALPEDRLVQRGLRFLEARAPVSIVVSSHQHRSTSRVGAAHVAR